MDLMRLSDSAMPVGAYAHSFGLETYIVEGKIREAEGLRQLLEAELKLRVASSELIFFTRIYKATLAHDIQEIFDLDEMLGVMKHPEESRLASLQMGRSLLRLSVGVTPTPLLEKIAAEVQKGTRNGEGVGHYLTLFSVVSAVREVPLPAAQAAYLYGYLNSRISVAVRLIPMGQTEGQRILLSLFPLCENLIKQSSGEIKSISDFSGVNDIQMMRHEKLESRTFRS